jgi:hypothetical protein
MRTTRHVEFVSGKKAAALGVQHEALPGEERVCFKIMAPCQLIGRAFEAMHQI